MPLRTSTLWLRLSLHSQPTSRCQLSALKARKPRRSSASGLCLAWLLIHHSSSHSSEGCVRTASRGQAQD